MHLKSSEAHNDFNVVSNFFCLVWSSMVSSFRLHLNAVSTSCVYNIASLTTWFRKLSMLIVGKTCNIALLKAIRPISFFSFVMLILLSLLPDWF
jgi:hypothetical protein